MELQQNDAIGPVLNANQYPPSPDSGYGSASQATEPSRQLMMDDDDDLNYGPPETYFYTTQCQEMNELRSLSIVNRWLESELVFLDDAADVDKLTPSELDFYRFIFTFLSAADDLVNCNLGNLMGLFEEKDIQHYYVEQESIEAVHSRVYSIIQLILFKNDATARAEYVKKAIRETSIRSKVKWISERVEECEDIPEKYILMILIEGLFFAASFAAIAYMRTRNIFVVTCQANTMISRDETIHTKASCVIYNKHLQKYKKPSTCRIYKLFSEAVKLECEFLRARAPSDSAIIDTEAICSYVRFNADRLLSDIGLAPLFDEPPPKHDFPLAFMATSQQTNFFERRNTTYAGSVLNDL
ncbi:UL40 [anatid alphaherpesvirus 1]|uniref:ribonucleoside-diphosphate reductase n=1 Tax=anatid alphaherpesvirus 1 TaxID=104388 RepID=G3GR00_9ALPH|nr:UL40 [Anatid alphaherpesvirus 1]AEN80086.1 UL40 [Anatid alphaherpesvirus 1]QOL71462.1 UL40 [Anatid alphaherpesvirus 1]UEC79301.1 UL40 [Anatid alphaherpesvirus 1]